MKSKRQRISALFLAFAILVGPLPPMTVHAADTNNAVTKGKWVLKCGITTTISYYEAVCNDLPYTKIDVYCTKDGNLCIINPISYNHCVTPVFSPATPTVTRSPIGPGKQWPGPPCLG